LGFTADYNKPDGFLGKEAVIKQRDEMKKIGGLKQRLVQVLVKDPDAYLYHGEILYRNNKIVGDVRAGSYGHTLGGAVGLALVTAVEDPTRTAGEVVAGDDGKKGPVVNKEYLTTGTWEIEIGHKRYPCVVSLAPLYDPNNSRIKA
jgi:glycine cleavage system aminomethyltransferase T